MQSLCSADVIDYYSLLLTVVMWTPIGPRLTASGICRNKDPRLCLLSNILRNLPLCPCPPETLRRHYKVALALQLLYMLRPFLTRLLPTPLRTASMVSRHHPGRLPAQPFPCPADVSTRARHRLLPRRLLARSLSVRRTVASLSLTSSSRMDNSPLPLPLRLR